MSYSHYRYDMRYRLLFSCSLRISSATILLITISNIVLSRSLLSFMTFPFASTSKSGLLATTVCLGCTGFVDEGIGVPSLSLGINTVLDAFFDGFFLKGSLNTLSLPNDFNFLMKVRKSFLDMFSILYAYCSTTKYKYRKSTSPFLFICFTGSVIISELTGSFEKTTLKFCKDWDGSVALFNHVLNQVPWFETLIKICPTSVISW